MSKEAADAIQAQIKKDEEVRPEDLLPLSMSQGKDPFSDSLKENNRHSLNNLSNGGEFPAGQVAPTWAERFFSPVMVLVYLTVLNTFCFTNRGLLSSSLPLLQVDSTISLRNPSLSYTSSGLIVSVFMIGFMVSSPIYARLGERYTPLNLISVSIFILAFGLIMTSTSYGYIMLLFARAICGIAESCSMTFNNTIIDNICPSTQRTLWLGILYIALPVGVAFGMIFGGILSSSIEWGNIGGWRVGFCILGVILLPYGVLGFFIPSFYNEGTKKIDTAPNEPTRKSAERQNLLSDSNEGLNKAIEGENNEDFNDSVAEKKEITIFEAAKVLMAYPPYSILQIGYMSQTFVYNALSSWSITYLVQGPLNASHFHASLLVGGSAVICGLLGALIGGFIVDKLKAGVGLEGCQRSQVFLLVTYTLTIPAMIGSFLSNNIWLYFALTCLLNLFLGSAWAPIKAGVLTLAPRHLRSYAMSVALFLSHLVGSFGGPFIAGLISDSFGSYCKGFNGSEENCIANTEEHDCIWVDDSCKNLLQLRKTMVIVTVFLVPGMLAFAGVFFLVRSELQKAEKQRMEDEKLDLAATGNLFE